MGHIFNSGDVGYCKYNKQTSSMLLTWDENTVIKVDCDYKTCGYADQCEMYQRHPIGFQRIQLSTDSSV